MCTRRGVLLVWVYHLHRTQHWHRAQSRYTWVYPTTVHRTPERRALYFHSCRVRHRRQNIQYMNTISIKQFPPMHSLANGCALRLCTYTMFNLFVFKIYFTLTCCPKNRVFFFFFVPVRHNLAVKYKMIEFLTAGLPQNANLREK